MNILFAAIGLFLLYQVQRFVYERYWNKNLDVTMSYSEGNRRGR